MKNYSLKFKNFPGFKKDGFSLIELLVALAVFSVSATIGLTVLLSARDAQQKILALRVTQDSLSYALDIMGKEIRTSSAYRCGIDNNDFSSASRDCSSGGPLFSFDNALGQRVIYRVTNGRLQKSVDGGGSFIYITAPEIEVNIEKLTFYVVGSLAGDNSQPRVTVVLRGTAGIKEKTKANLNIQTTISQRLLDS